MKSNYSNRGRDGISRDRTNYTPYDDYNILEPSPEIDLNFSMEDEDELSDYSLMDDAVDINYEE
jgi:hypothetical protein